MSSSNYVYALRFRALNSLYDPIVRLMMAEGRFRKKLISLMGGLNTDRILDVACGTGTFTRMLKKARPSLNIIGLDDDTKILKIANTKASREALQIEYRKGNALKLPFESECFEVVTTSLFLHHLENKDKKSALNEVNRVLKPGGRFLICDWGKPRSILAYILFVFVRVFDGFSVTKAHNLGLLPEMISKSGFTNVISQKAFPTALGTVEIWTADKL